MIHSRALFTRSVAGKDSPSAALPVLFALSKLQAPRPRDATLPATIHDRLAGGPAGPKPATGDWRHEAPSALPVLDAERRHYSLREAQAYCERLLRARSDSFELPLAQSRLPRAVQPHVLAIYAFERAADDFADEPTYAGQRHFALEQWEHELFRTFHGEATHPIFVALRDTIERFDLPVTPFSDLLSAFRMELSPPSFPTFDALRVYCRHRSEPLGQLVLRLFGHTDALRLRYAADMAVAFQLTTFLQDLCLDLDRGRVYLPGEDLAHFDLTSGPTHAPLAALSEAKTGAAPHRTRAFRDLLRFQTARTRSFYERGRPLLGLIENDLGLELSLTFHSGLALLDKIDALGEELLRARPSLGKTEIARVAARALSNRVPRLLQRGAAVRSTQD